jgi:hypothetical protein
MKLLESSNFEAVNSALFVETGESKIVGRYTLLEHINLIFNSFHRDTLIHYFWQALLLCSLIKSSHVS